KIWKRSRRMARSRATSWTGPRRIWSESPTNSWLMSTGYSNTKRKNCSPYESRLVARHHSRSQKVPRRIAVNERKQRGDRSPQRRPAEGVRIIRADEAQAALDAGEAAGRRPDDQLRFGDVPPAPAGPRTPHRFPLPDSVDPAGAVSLPPLASPDRG